VGGLVVLLIVAMMIFAWYKVKMREHDFENSRAYNAQPIPEEEVKGVRLGAANEGVNEIPANPGLRYPDTLASHNLEGPY
jgi:hypothetical protein